MTLPPATGAVERRSGRAVPRHASDTPLDARGTLTSAAKGVGVPVLVAAVVTAGAPGWTTYTVRRGDTLGGIAKRSGTSVGALVRANHLPAHGDTVYAGASLRIPVRAPVVRRTAVVVTARPGDSLWTIAHRYRTTIPALVRANALRTIVIQPGQRLRVGTRTVVVRAGTTSTASSGNTFAGRTYSDGVVSAAARNRAVLDRRATPSRARVRQLITRTAQRYGVPASLALAVSWQESGWQHDRVSVANAIGAMQVVPSTGAWVSSVIGRQLDLLDPEDNVTAGVVLLSLLLRQANERDSVAGYYQGLASVRRNGLFADTKQYVASVAAIRSRLAG